MNTDLSMRLEKVEEQIRASEKSGLPGWKAHQDMLPEFRIINPDLEGLSPAAVLICLMKNSDGDLYFPLIRRTAHDRDRHSGQISLPGGRRDNGEDLSSTAVREAVEEIGLPAGDLKILGRLSPLPIPVSGYMVHPFIAYCDKEFEYRPNPLEVDAVFDVPLPLLLHPDSRGEETRKDRRIPYFRFRDNKVWGATAMILSEFAYLLRGF